MGSLLLLTEEQRALQDAAASFLADFGNARAPDSVDSGLWRRMVELGWTAVHAPEGFGGLGLGAVEVCLLMEEMGRRLVRSPFLANVALAQTVLMEAATPEAQDRWLPALIAGEASATLIQAPGLDGALDALSIEADCDGDAWVLNGVARQVIDDGSADMAFVVARLSGGHTALFHVPADAPGLTRAPRDLWDQTRPQASWAFEDVRLPPAARIDEPGRLDAGLARTIALAALYVAAEQVGGAAQCLDMTVAYTMERTQFGRPIASFQAVKHRCAEMMVLIETARSAVRGVAVQAAEVPDAQTLAREVAVARVLAVEAYRYCAQEAVQLHGGVGFTWEYDPQLHFKRAQWGSQWFGPVGQWRETVADHLLGLARKECHG